MSHKQHKSKTDIPPEIVWTGVAMISYINGIVVDGIHASMELKQTEIRLFRSDGWLPFEAEYVSCSDRFGAKQWQDGIYGDNMERVLAAALKDLLSKPQP